MVGLLEFGFIGKLLNMVVMLKEKETVILSRLMNVVRLGIRLCDIGYAFLLSWIAELKNSLDQNYQNESISDQNNGLKIEI